MRELYIYLLVAMGLLFFTNIKWRFSSHNSDSPKRHHRFRSIRKISQALLCAFLLLTANLAAAQEQPTFGCAPEGYLFQGEPTSAYSVDLITGQATLVKDNLLGTTENARLNSFGYNAKDNYIWGTRTNTNELVRIGSDWSATTFPIPGLPTDANFFVGDFDLNGIMYLYNGGGTSTQIYRVDLNPTSPTYLTLLPSLTTSAGYSIFDWAFNPLDGNLYAMGSGGNFQLLRFSTSTGAVTQVGTVSGGGIQAAGEIPMGAAYMDNEGSLYLASNATGRIFKIATTQTGNLTATLFSTGPTSDNNDGARCPLAPLVVDPPVAVNDSTSTPQGIAVDIPVLTNDAAGASPLDPATVKLLDPANGSPVMSLTVPNEGTYTVNATSGAVTFTPVAAFRGTATPVNYTVADESGVTSAPATITVLVTGPEWPIQVTDDPPQGSQFNCQTLYISRGASNIVGLVNDADGNPLLSPVARYVGNVGSPNVAPADGFGYWMGSLAIGTDPETGNQAAFGTTWGHGGQSGRPIYKMVSGEGTLKELTINDTAVKTPDLHPWGGLAYNSVDGMLYGIVNNSQQQNTDYIVFRMNLQTGVVEQKAVSLPGATQALGSIMPDMFFDAEGAGYLGAKTTASGTNPWTLYRIDFTQTEWVGEPIINFTGLDSFNIYGAAYLNGFIYLGWSTGVIYKVPFERNLAGIELTTSYPHIDDYSANIETPPSGTPSQDGFAVSDLGSCALAPVLGTPPTAVNDSTTTAAGTPVDILVLANDSIGGSPLDSTSVKLIDPASGDSVTTVTVAGEGAYVVDTTTGAVTFTPEAGFTGVTTPVTYTVAGTDGAVSNPAIITVEVTPAAATVDLAIVKMGPEAVAPDSAITYTLLITNSGPDAADGAIVTDPEIANFTATSIACAAGSGAGGAAACPIDPTVAALQGSGLVIPTLPSGSSITLTITGTAGASGTITNVATIAAPTGVTDTNAANNTDTKETLIGPDCIGEQTVYAFDPDATLAQGTAIAANGGSINLIYTLQSGTAIPSIGNTFTVPLTYSDFNQIYTGSDHTWSGATVLETTWDGTNNTKAFTLVPNTNSLYQALPANNTTQKPVTSPNTTDNFFTTYIANGSLDQLGTFDITIGALPETPEGVNLVSESIRILSSNNLSTNGNGNDQAGWWVKPIAQTRVYTRTAAGQTEPLSVTHGKTYTFKYSAFTDNSNLPGAERGALLDFGQIVFCTPQGPIAVNDSTTTDASTPVIISVLANDSIGSSPLDSTSVKLIDPASGDSVTTVTVPNEGVYEVNPTTGAVTFTPETGFTGVTTPVTYTVADVNGVPSNPATITITVSAVQPPFDCAAGLAYLLQGSPTAVYTVNLATGAYTQVVSQLIPGTTNVALNAAGYNTKDNLLWAYRIGTNEIISIGSDWSIETHPIVGLPVSNFNVGDINADGVMYLYNGSGTINTIYRVDVDPASPTYLTLLPSITLAAARSLSDWAFSPVDGNLYTINNTVSGGTTNYVLWRVNATTGAFTNLGMISGGGIQVDNPVPSTGVEGFGGAYMDDEGGLYLSANSSGKIYKIANPHEGATTATFVSNGPISGNNDGARCPAPVAAPPTAANDSTTTNVGTPVIIPVLANDSIGDSPIDSTSVKLIDPVSGDSVTTVTVPNEGTYVVDPTTGDVTFTPEDGFTGATTPITYTVSDENGVPSNPATITVTVNNATFTLTKVVTGTVPDTVGGVLHYNIVAVNTGDVVLSNIVVSDDNATITGGSPIVTLAVGDSATVTAEHILTAADLDSAKVINQAKAIGEDPSGNPTPEVPSDDPSTPEPGDPTETPLPATPPTAVSDSTNTTPGTPVTIPVLTNDTPGGSPLDPTSVKLIDPVSGDSVTTVTVPNEGTYVVDPTTGDVTFTPEDGFTGATTPITYTVSDENGVPSNPATIAVTVSNATFTLTKVVTGTVPDTVGGVLHYNIVAVNTGDVVLSNIVVSDDNATITGGSPIVTLAVGDSATVTAEHILTAADLDSAKVINQAKAIGEDPSGNPTPEVPSDDPSTPEPGDPTETPLPAAPPTAVDDSTSTTPGTPVTIPVLENDSTGTHPIDPATVTITTPPTNGTVTVNPDGTVEYTPNPDYTGPDTFEYTVDDEEGNPSNPATVTVTVSNATFTLSKVVSGAVPDTVGGILHYNIVAVNTGDVVLSNIVVSDDNATITGGSPIATLAVGDSATVTAEHILTAADLDSAKVVNQAKAIGEDPSGNPTPEVPSDDPNTPEPNDPTETPLTPAIPPTAVDDQTGTTPNTPVTIPVLTNDSTGTHPIDPATVTITTPPTNGTVTVNPDGTVEYTPNPDFTGEDTFEYTVDDEEGNPSNPATVTVRVNEGPTAVDDTAETTPETPVVIPVLTNDTEGNSPLDPSSVKLIDPVSGDSVTTVTVPNEGVYEVNPTTGAVTFTPEEGFTGVTTPIEYTVSDENGVPSNPATITVTVNSATFTLTKVVTGTVPTTVGGVLHYNIVATNTGNVVLSNIVVTDDNATITGGSPIASLAVGASATVTAEHILTAADLDSAKVINQAKAIGEDPSGKPTPEVPSDDPGTPEPNDPTETPLPATPPTAVDDQTGTTPNTPVTIPVLENDSTGTHPIDPATVTITTPPTNGTVTVNPDGTVEYTPNPDFTGEDTFEYTVDDEEGNPSNPATVTVRVNEGPTAVDDTAETTPETPVVIPVLTNDTEGNSPLDPSSVKLIDPVSGDSVTTVTVPNEGVYEVNPTTGAVTFTPEEGFTGVTTPIEYTVSDENGVPSNPATITVTVNSATFTLTKVVTGAVPNTVGGVLHYNIVATNTGNVVLSNIVVSDDNATITGGSPIASLAVGASATVTAEHILTAADLDSAKVINQAKAIGEDPSGKPTPEVPSDDPGTPEPNDPTETPLTPVTPPTAVNDSTSTNPGTPVTIPVLTNDTPGDSPIDPATVTITIPPTNGTVTVNPDGTVEYTPNPDFTGEDTFEYTVDDEEGNPSNPATVTVRVNEGPTAVDDTAETTPETPVVIPVLTNDTEGNSPLDPSSVKLIDPVSGDSVTTVTVPNEGTYVVDPAIGEVTFTPEEGFTGVTTPIEYTVSDENGVPSNPATITVTVNSATFTLTKVVTGAVPTTVGGVLHYNIVATNTGNVVLSNIVVTDDNATITGGSPIASLAVGASATVTAEHILTAADLDSAKVVNQAKAIGEDPSGKPTPEVPSDDPGTPEPNDPTETPLTPVTPPIAVNDSTSTNPGTPVTIPVLTNDTPGDSPIDPATVTITTPPTNGTVTVNPDGTVEYTPNPDFTGEDTFEYTVDDEEGNPSNPATVTVRVNEGPTAVDDTAETTPETPVVIPVLTNDTEGNSPLDPTSVKLIDPVSGDSVTTVTVPNEGVYEVNPTTGAVTFTPEEGFTGVTTPIEYTVSDENGVPSNPATITVTVNSATFTLTKVVTGAVPTTVGGVLHYNIVATNTGNVVLSNIVVSDDNATITGGSPIASLAVGASATVTAEHILTAADLDSAKVINQAKAIGEDPSGKPTPEVPSDDPGTPEPNDPTETPLTPVTPPTAVNDSASTNPGTPVTIPVLTNDTPGDSPIDPATVTITTPPTNGTVTVNPDGTVEYTPNPGYTGPDTFEYTVDDEEGNPSNPATVTVRVNEGPTAIDDSTSTNPGTPVTIPVLANDVEKNSPLDVTTVKLVDPLNGDLVNRVTIPNEGVYEVNPTTGGVTFTPEAGFTGVTTPVQYRVEDQNGGLSNPATITVTVNEGPTAIDDSTSTNPGTPVTIPVLTNDTPGDSPIDPSTVTITTPPTHGTVTVNPNGTVIYTPEPGYTGPDEFEYTVDDENGVPSNPAKVVVTVNRPVTPPTAVNDNTSTNPGTPVTIPVLTNDTPGDSPIDPSTVTITTPPTHGTVTVNPNGTVIYTPEPGYTGPDEFEYTVDDENGVPSNPAKVVVTVNPPVTPPTADDDETTTDGDTPVIIPILDNDTEGTNPIDPSKVKITRPPVHGTVEVKPDGTIVYTPAPGYTGPDEFEYTVDDANGVPSNPAKVKITVNAGPKAIDDEATTMSAVPVKITILNNDEPGSSPLDVATVEIINAPQNGTAAVNPDGTVTYTSNKGYLGTDRFTYRVKDQRGLWTNVANVVIEVTANPLFIPNFFTPNGDGQNDVFEIVGIEAYDRVELFIFNRWGDEVYNNPNYINNWDGSNLNEGTYYYLVKLRKEGREETMKGWVLLKKQ